MRMHYSQNGGEENGKISWNDGNAECIHEKENNNDFTPEVKKEWHTKKKMLFIHVKKWIEQRSETGVKEAKYGRKYKWTNKEQVKRMKRKLFYRKFIYVKLS